ncbi:acyl-CoA thioesterase [Hyunsoonleella sp. SJ7]|uniref:Acyl-CoA thioesterase n=1 Tax=Hyunsoonleella aquatilis TaxID=2762758 RepID=A0A923KL12_9FLAO|nr:acyl-CoA thioesterase [Hyunsoonleella aquatilis]MBC3757430.1 acyl-CoA thioesterase [Hyunsoonleella aquatilis]
MEAVVIESKKLIRFQDCDPFNHLNNGKYFDYFMNAREDHLRKHYNFDIYKHALKTGESWLVTNSQIAYLSPAFLMEEVVIQSKFLEWNPKDILVEMQMWNNEKTKLKSLLWTRFAHFNLRTQQSIAHSSYINEVFGITGLPFEKHSSFNQRIKDVKKTGAVMN